MRGRDLTALTATEALSEMAGGRLTSEALVSACLERIAERDKAVEAWAFIDPAKALREAREADAARARGGQVRPLEGIPVGVKDIIDTAEYPTEYGSPVFKVNYPAADATIVGELKRAGAIILGKTVTTELAFFGPGKTRNPRNPDYTPGGSSSGSAAAVADCQLPLALGTQTAGSIIRPASFCGTIGFKPTFGYISRTGILPQSPPLDTVGGYARSIQDIALLIDALSAYDPRDRDMTSGPKVPLTTALSTTLNRPPRFAFIKSPAWPNADAETQSAFESYANSFGARAEVVEVPLPAEFDGSLRMHQIVQFSDIAKNFGPIADKNPDKVSQKLKDTIAEGRTFKPADIAAARAEREPLYEALRLVLVDYDAILTPAAPGPALKGLGATGSPMFNALWTYLGMPCISLPLLEANGLPLGVQLVAARGEDGALLRAASWLMENGQGHTTPRNA
jgi:Asp-tRNA(Asn)/Glu-tRNA(Gln) amidotransferase A subunit family amidase